MVQNYGFIKKAFDKWFYGVQEYNRFGLYKSDLYRDGHEDVAEAVRRLPDDLYTGRIHRCHRAIQVSRAKDFLPKALWTAQEDPMHNYLDPYLEEIEKENAEKAEWNKK
ncbi:hypothetical protein BV898_00783 [Hypsibius exemplaris]|uniref:Cytochrome b-c1 complex subunit 7 n=1 Tax=Hypsibius exemplaris TaxID=2072580 RepID=A0A1W0XCC0_HYPEX|nr:hypothetical protein BV898_00783 [Hypsibius exemplaris]